MPAQKITKEKRCERATKSAMAAKDLTQAKLGKHIGLKQSGCGSRIKNLYGMPLGMVIELSSVLGINLYEIAKENWKEEKA